tara:strand:+ start:3645 stop:3878 length:234 start_codon:yes stop_codon:yes gene_type:complete
MNKLMTIGWTEPVSGVDLESVLRSDLIVSPPNGSSEMTLERIIQHANDTRPDHVIVDGDVFHEMVDRILALEGIRHG